MANGSLYDINRNYGVPWKNSEQLQSEQQSVIYWCNVLQKVYRSVRMHIECISEHGVFLYGEL
jgi:hypothetical protein